MAKTIRELETQVLTTLIDGLIEEGYTLTVSYGEGQYGVKKSKDRDAILADLWACDEEWLHVHKDGKAIGQVFLIYGECGYDVICDHSESLTATKAIQTVDALVDRLMDEDEEG
jgi:hypothetical protein